MACGGCCEVGFGGVEPHPTELAKGRTLPKLDAVRVMLSPFAFENKDADAWS